MDFATPKQEGSSIATTLEGALKQKYIKAVFATLIRNLPYNNILFSFFKEKIQQSALRYHLRKALEKSQDIESFKTNLQIRAEKANFNNATMQIIQNILKDTTQAIDEAREGAKTPTGVFTKAQEQETQQAQNKAFSASKQETQETQQAKQTQLEQTQLTQEQTQLTQEQTQLTQEQTQLTTKTPQEIKDIISKWDLSKETNAQAKQRLIISKVSDSEKELLQKEFNFKGAKDLVREIDSHQIIHTLKQHSNEFVERQRGQEPITFDDIAQYETITQQYDLRIAQDNGRIIYAKQVNGSYVVVEEVLEGQDKIRFFDMWKQKGQINKEVLLSHSQRPNTIPSPSLESPMPSNTQNLTTKDKIKQARELGLNAKEAVHYIKTNNLPQTRANTLPQGREILEAEIVETQEIPYSQKKLIEWIINKHPKLIGSNQEARLTTKELLEFIKEENLPAKEALKLIKNTPRNLPIKIDSTSKQTTQNVDSSHPKPQINKAIKDIIDSSPAKGRDMQIIGEANFTPQVVEYAHKNNKKVAIDKLSQAEAEQLRYKYPSDVRVTIDYQAINHTLNRHGADSNLVKESGQKPVDYTDIAEYRSIVKGADEKLFSKDDLGQDVILSFKQVNGYAVVVESIRKKGNELAFKSMYFENGSYKNSNAYKNAVDSQKANPSPAPYGYEPHADANTPPKVDSDIIPQQTQKSLFDTPKLESNLNHTLESYKDLIRATTELKRSIFEKENELKDLVAEKEKIQQWAETIKEQSNSRALTKIAGELKKIGFDTFSKHPMLDYEASRVKKVNPRLDGEEFYDESTIINFKDLKKFIKSRDDFIKFKNKLDTLYLPDSPYGQARYIHKIKDFNNTKQAGFYQAFNENNYDNIIKELIDKEASKVKNIDNDKIISLQKELEQLKEQLEKTNQSLAQSERELEQIPFLQKLFNNKPLFDDFLTLRFNTMSEKELKKQAQEALIDIDTSRSYFERSLNITPIKEFGTNYAEHYHSGESAIQKLLLERNGQVSGAFYRKELGDIDLFWGDSSKGLAHIIERRKQDFIEKGFSQAEAEQKALEFVKSLPDIIENGNIDKRIARAFLETQDSKAVIALDFNDKDNKWILTAYNKDDALNPAYSHQVKHNTNTSSETRASGDSEIIPQNANALQKAQMQNNSVQKPNRYQILRATSDYVSLKKEVMYAKQSLQRRKADLQEAIKENNKETIQWAKGAIANIEKKIKSSQQDLNKEIQRIKKLGISLENPLNLKTTPMPNTKMQELQAIYKNVFPSLQSIDKAINSAKTQKEKDKLHKQRQHIINKFDKQMQALLKDFTQQRQLLMRVNLTRGMEEIQELESIHFDFENPFSVYNLDKTIYRQEWGNADGNYYQTQLVEARIFFDRFEPVIRQQIKSNINGVEDFSKGLIKDDDIFNLKTDVKNIRENIEILYNITPIKEFGTNYAEHYHSGESAIQKLLTEAQAHKQSGAKGEYKGQVAGAFYRDDIGDITLAWGEKGTGKSDGWGLSKIAEYHPEVLDKLHKLIQDLPIVKETENRYKLDNGDFFISIRKDFEGQKQNWVLTALERDESIARRRTDLPSSQSEAEKTTSANASEIIPQTPQEIIKQAKEQGKSVKETKELLQKNKELQAANNQKIKEFEKKLYESDALARKMEYTSDSSGLSTKSYSHNENLERYFKDKFIDVDDFLTLKNLDKKSAEYKALLEKMYYKQQEQKANVKALGDLDSNVVAEQSQDYMQNYIKQIHNMSEQELINERKKLLTMPLHNDNMRLMNAQMQEALESFMYPNMKYFTQNPTIYTFLRNGEKFDKRNAAKKLSLQEFDTYRKMLEQDLNLTAIKEFGQNYTEYYRDGVGAIQKLINEANAHKQSGVKTEYKGQVAGAFHRKELGDIDLVWGNGDIGLQKIVEKHLNDFADFAGNNPYEKMSNAINEIIQNGKLLTENGVNTLWYKNGDHYYLVGISKGFNKQGDNNWIVTSYKKDKITNLQKEKVDKLLSSDAEVLSAQGKFNELETLNSTTTEIIPQTPQEIIKQAKEQGKSVKETKELLQKHKDNKIINTLKDMQDKDINVKLDNKELLELYEKSSREAYDFLAKKLYLDSVKQYRSDGYALFENSSLGANAKGSFEAILRKNIRQRQLENFQKPQNVKYEIQTEQGFKYYLDENNDVVINHKNELVDFKGGVVRTKPDKDGDILELNGVLKLISPRNADNMFLAKRELTNNEFYDFEANLRLANYYQNGLFVSDEKLYEVFKNMPRNADKQGLDDVMGILRGLTKSKNVNMAYAQEFIDKHYGLEADYRTLARDIFKRVDKEYKKNGNPFGILFNDQKAIKDLSDMYGDEMARDFFKGKNAVDFLLYTQAGHIENAFYRKELGDIDLVWGEVTGSGKEAKGWGLAKIIEKHLNAGDFKAFGEGEQGLINAINQIIQDGKVVTQNGVDSIVLRKNGEEYRVGISKGWDNVGENKWIITSYKNNKYKESAETSYHDTFTSKEPLENPVSTIIPQESKSIKEEEIKEFLKNHREQINSNYPQETATLILQQNKDNGIVLSGFEIKGKDYDPQLEVLEFKSKKAQREFETLMKSYDTKGDFLKFEKMGVFKPNDEAFLQYLKKYKDDKNAKLALAYNLSKDLIRMQGGGRLEVFMTNFLRQIHILENQNSTIYQSNPHIGAGLLGGSVNGLEQDENGNLVFSPEKFALGFLGGAAGSKAVAQGFKYLKENPQVKEAVVKELADTLALGFEKAREKYPLLSLLQPRYMVQNQRGRSIQAKSMLKELEKEQTGLYNVVYNGKNATLIQKDLEAVDEAILFERGTKRKGGKHIRLAHSTEPLQQGYVTKQEVANLGVNIRSFLSKYKEPFIDKNGARLYEWEDENAVKFRVVVNDIQDSGGNSHLPSASEEIITFYSDRNLKEAMEFKNPVLKQTIIDVKKMQKAREKEHFYSTFSLQDVLDNTFIKLNNIEDRYYGSIQIDPKLKEGEYHISSNQLYLNKADFNKNKISDEAIRDFLKSLRLLENNNNYLWEAQNIAYKHNIPLSLAKKVMQEQKQYQKEIPLFKEAREHFKEFEPRKIKDLLEWHKDSSALTKDEQGLPRVFYHGSTSGKKIIEFDRQFDKSGWGFWFSPIRAVSAGFAKHRKPQAVFLKLEKPFDMTKGVDFDLMLKEQLFFRKEQIEELKPEFKKIQKIYKGLLQDLDKQGIKPIEFFDDGSFYGIRNNKLGFFNTEAGEMGGLKGVGLTHKIQALPLTQNYKAFKEWLDKHNVRGGIRNEYDLLFRLTKQGDYYNNQVQSDLSVRGYDGIKVSENEFTIFDSSQAKAVDNKGAYSDGYDVWDKPSKKEIKENELEHKYFNESSPNIFHSNPHAGAGLLGGSVAGIEQDENGNLVFSPEKFVLGFLGGAVGSKGVSKIYNNKSAQRHATLAIKSIQQDYKALSEKNPVMFAKIMQKIDTRDFLKGKKQVEEVSKDIFNKQLAQAIESALQNGKVEVMPKAEFRNKEEFAALFDSVSGNKGIIQTPYKEVKADIKSAWKHFTYNTHNTDRENIKGGFFKTFKEPLFVVEQTRQGQKEPSVYFYKPFYDENKKLMNLFGIGIDSSGNVDFKTYYFDKKRNRLKEILMSDKVKIVYVQENL